jgi:predicted CopG family antitoxin
MTFETISSTEVLMRKKLTITLDERVYDGLHKTMGRGNISQFIEALVRRQILDADVEAGYREMAHDEVRETESHQWVEATLGDAYDAAR